ncbi:MAG: GAF domain-containing sensor histidine kinase [Bdellovibrionales bacterium]
MPERPNEIDPAPSSNSAGTTTFNDTLVSDVFSGIIQKINEQLGTGVAFDQLLDFVFESLGLMIPYDRMGIAVLEGKVLRLTWVRSKVLVRHLAKNYSAPVKGSSLEQLLKSGKPRIIDDLREYLCQHPNSASTKLILQDGIVSSLTCPLIANGKPIGVVFFSSCKPYTYQDQHINTFMALAAELAVVVEQASLRKYFDEGQSRESSFSRVLHDLKSPLTLIQGFIELARGEPWYEELRPEAKKVCETLARNTKFMFDLLNELGELGQLGRSASESAVDLVNLPPFCSEMASYGKILAEKKEIHFEAVFDSNLPKTASFDPGKIRRVLDNLITNAVKFSDRGSTIRMQITFGNDRLIFSVTDEGHGIPESELPKLFLEFGKTSTRPTEGEGSTGLGLAIAKKLVEQHGGLISAQSQLKKGSTFSFWIPYRPASKLH